MKQKRRRAEEEFETKVHSALAKITAATQHHINGLRSVRDIQKEAGTSGCEFEERLQAARALLAVNE